MTVIENQLTDHLNSYQTLMWTIQRNEKFKGSSDPSHFIFEINVGKGRIRHKTTLNLNDAILKRLWIDLEIPFQSRSISDPTFSDIDFENKIAGLPLKLHYIKYHDKRRIFRHEIPIFEGTRIKNDISKTCFWVSLAQKWAIFRYSDIFLTFLPLKITI